jgi:hypothetical protein
VATGATISPIQSHFTNIHIFPLVAHYFFVTNLWNISYPFSLTPERGYVHSEAGLFVVVVVWTTEMIRKIDYELLFSLVLVHMCDFTVW